MVFPQNSLGHFKSLKENGITSYRGKLETWYSSLPNSLQKLARQVDDFSTICPGVSIPKLNEFGLLNIPGNMPFRRLPFGVKKKIPYSIFLKKGIKGVNRAAKEKKVFHVWFHPFNFAFEEEAQFDCLEKLLIHVQTNVNLGKIDSLTMKQVEKQVL